MRHHHIVDQFPASFTYRDYIPALREGKTVQIDLLPEDNPVKVRRSVIASFSRWIRPTDSHRLRTAIRGSTLSLQLVPREQWTFSKRKRGLLFTDPAKGEHTTRR